MTISMTRASTFTIADARYVSSKLGADLRNLNARYSKPALSNIDDFVEETAQYLKAGYLESVDFGFKDGDRWILRLRYTAAAGGQLQDEAPGRLPSAVDVIGYAFHSYLKPNSTFYALGSADQAAFEGALRIQRGIAPEPSAFEGQHGNQAQYARNGAGLNRTVYSVA
jgi:hypothetical protein